MKGKQFYYHKRQKKLANSVAQLLQAEKARKKQEKVDEEAFLLS